MTEELVEVVQADRDAEKAWRLHWSGCEGERFALRLAFARHRIAAAKAEREECARVAEQAPERTGLSREGTCREIAVTIRARNP